MSKGTGEEDDDDDDDDVDEEEAEPIGALYRVVCSFMGHGLSASRFGLIIIIAILSPHRIYISRRTSLPKYVYYIMYRYIIWLI